jgi:hypothetical protein
MPRRTAQHDVIERPGYVQVGSFEARCLSETLPKYLHSFFIRADQMASRAMGSRRSSRLLCHRSLWRSIVGAEPDAFYMEEHGL